MSCISRLLLQELVYLGGKFKKEEDLSDESKIYVSGFMDSLGILQSYLIKNYEKIKTIDLMLFLDSGVKKLTENLNRGIISKKYFFGAMDLYKIPINYVVDAYFREIRG